MAMFDWNHDGKKNYVDTAIEMMVLDDIEADKGSKAGSEKAGDRQYTGYMKEEDEYKGTGSIAPAFRIIGVIAAIGILLPNIIGISSGHVSIAGIVVGIGILAAVGISQRKK